MSKYAEKRTEVDFVIFYEKISEYEGRLEYLSSGTPLYVFTHPRPQVPCLMHALLSSSSLLSLGGNDLKIDKRSVQGVHSLLGSAN